MTLLINIALWLISVWSNPTVQIIVVSVVKDLLSKMTQDVAPAVVKAVEEAMTRDDLTTGSAKFDYVQAQILEQFPKIEKSLLNSLIENTLNALKKQ
jgi:hypothetical protein